MREGGLETPTRHQIDWQNPDYYDEIQLDAELRRVFDICHGCRRCFNLCDSFPRLFDLIDATSSGEIKDVASADFAGVVDACTLCDMCFANKCPYVPPHEFNLDVPHLMLRYRAVEAKKHGVPLADRELTKTDRNGRLAGWVAPLANWATAASNLLTRQVMKAVLGIHPDAALPRYERTSFVEAARKNVPEVNKTAPAYGKRKAVLYATCSINYNDPDLGALTRRVLARNGVETEVVYPGCCGMPQLEQGDIASVVSNARRIVAALTPWIDKDYDIIALVPSCALMFKQEWPLLMPKDDADYAVIMRLADATYDLSEYIVDIAKSNGLADGMKPVFVETALHIACHARAQNIGAKAAEMLRLLPASTAPTVIERCSGHGGSWGIKTENFETALKVGKPVARKAVEVAVRATEKNIPAYVASECPLAAAHIAQGIERQKTDGMATPRTLHPIELFAMSFGITRDQS